MLKKGILLYRIAIICFGLWGLSYLLPNELYKMTYYTNISNCLVVGFYVYDVFSRRTDYSFIYLRLKAGMTISVVLTFLVYCILLAPIAKPEEFFHIKNYTLHYIVPIMTFVDWLICDKKGAYLFLDPLRWTLVPLLYCVYSLIRGFVFHIPIPNETHSPYPYFFLNIDKYGWDKFFIYFISILICYISIGYMMYGIKYTKK
ncbi:MULTISPECIES: Pr6Pr family membrane protein [unclassified Granulicatella]|uniref:Pr6Pr family membrane protein n=1 Tax=unclassified Granulicatella TaxID=2630493 RepID=UPI0010746BAD|nr:MULTISPECIES: Pr6Pr family membrane protein [unclassified Granulicatella]MBF0780068.1 Pr6Pr family membrane protein [Granulicatella sp. 19428wC4_WM01]TFU95853.1 hypothetical protein E4T68_03085 [Granulicatella sp. WM01]